jgi:hypothetical protein
LISYYFIFTITGQIPLSTDEKSLSLFYEWINKGGVEYEKVLERDKIHKKGDGNGEKEGEGKINLNRIFCRSFYTDNFYLVVIIVYSLPIIEKRKKK